MSHALPPIETAYLFPEVCRRLHVLLRSLAPEDWNRPTTSSRRTVKDIASHLLDGSLRRLSVQRDGYRPPGAPAGSASERELAAWLHEGNARWESATRGLSPRVLVDLMERADAELAALFASLDPHGPAIFAVSWAGESQSENWFDVAREYTEKWHHAQQIFEATGRPSTIATRRLYHPCLDTFLRSLPHAFREAEAPEGMVVSVVVTGEAGGEWFAERGAGGWSLTPAPSAQPASVVTIPQESAWKLLTKRHGREAALARFPEVAIAGDRRLGLHVLDAVAVVA